MGTVEQHSKRSGKGLNVVGNVAEPRPYPVGDCRFSAKPRKGRFHAASNLSGQSALVILQNLQFLPGTFSAGSTATILSTASLRLRWKLLSAASLPTHSVSPVFE